jgi:transposase-like protein
VNYNTDVVHLSIHKFYSKKAKWVLMKFCIWIYISSYRACLTIVRIGAVQLRYSDWTLSISSWVGGEGTVKYGATHLSKTYTFIRKPAEISAERLSSSIQINLKFLHFSAVQCVGRTLKSRLHWLCTSCIRKFLKQRLTKKKKKKREKKRKKQCCYLRDNLQCQNRDWNTDWSICTAY